MNIEKYPLSRDGLFDFSSANALKLLRDLYPLESPVILRKARRRHSVIFDVSLEYERKVLRIHRRSSAFSVRAVVAAFQSWSAIGVPVPHILAYGEDRSVEYLLMNYIDKNLFMCDGSEELQTVAAEQMGCALASMRRVLLRGYGFLNDESVGQFGNWSEFIESQYPHLWLYKNGDLTGEENKLLKHLKQPDLLPNLPSVLLHGDFKPSNTFIGTDGEVVAIVDPAPMAGDPLWDFANFNHYVYRGQARSERPYDDPRFGRLRAAFKDAYQAKLGRELTGEEKERIVRNEIIIDISKIAGLKRRQKKTQNGEHECMLVYVRQKMRELSDRIFEGYRVCL